MWIDVSVTAIRPSISARTEGRAIDRDSLVAALLEKDRVLGEVLDGVEDEDEIVIGFYGKLSLAAYLSVIPQHEGIHHGQWSFYAMLGGFETPDGWQINWGL